MNEQTIARMRQDSESVLFTLTVLDKSSQKPWDRNEKKIVMKSSLNYLNSFQVITPKSYSDLLSKLILTMPI